MYDQKEERKKCFRKAKHPKIQKMVSGIQVVVYLRLLLNMLISSVCVYVRLPARVYLPDEIKLRKEGRKGGTVFHESNKLGSESFYIQPSPMRD